MNKRVKVLGIVLLVLAFGCSGLFAEGPEKEEHHFDWMAFSGKLVNAVILFGLLIYLLKKPISNYLKQKSLEIHSDISRREETLSVTSSQLEEIKERLKKIEEEIAGMKITAEEQGNTERKRIEENAETEAQRILELTEAEIDTKVENAIRNLKSRITDLTIEHFKNDIGAQLDARAHEKIIEKNIESCGDILERT